MGGMVQDAADALRRRPGQLDAAEAEAVKGKAPEPPAKAASGAIVFEKARTAEERARQNAKLEEMLRIHGRKP